MHGRDWTPKGEVIRLLLEAGNPNRAAANQMIQQHFVRGAVERIGSRGNFSYRLVGKDGTAPAPRRHLPARTGTSCMTLTEPAGAYVGPAFDLEAPLTPSLGLRCEVMPPEIGRMIDSLHQRFFREARGVE
ncbi:hypothetical protein [Luteimonas terricola]|nr:hypothetical protein [Luteimonas terricola]